jgi:hypothetical protein
LVVYAYKYANFLGAELEYNQMPENPKMTDRNLALAARHEEARRNILLIIGQE